MNTAPALHEVRIAAYAVSKAANEVIEVLPRRLALDHRTACAKRGDQ